MFAQPYEPDSQTSKLEQGFGPDFFVFDALIYEWTIGRTFSPEVYALDVFFKMWNTWESAGIKTENARWSKT